MREWTQRHIEEIRGDKGNGGMFEYIPLTANDISYSNGRVTIPYSNCIVICRVYKPDVQYVQTLENTREYSSHYEISRVFTQSNPYSLRIGNIGLQNHPSETEINFPVTTNYFTITGLSGYSLKFFEDDPASVCIKSIGVLV